MSPHCSKMITATQKANWQGSLLEQEYSWSQSFSNSAYIIRNCHTHLNAILFQSMGSNRWACRATIMFSGIFNY